MTYYGVYHAIVGMALAAGAGALNTHRSALSHVANRAEHGFFPQPWGAWCAGCPQTGTERYGGVAASPVGVVSALARPDPATSSDRLRMLLRTTRRKELDRRFDEERQRRVRPNRLRRNLSRDNKNRLAESMDPTTLFDVLWRVRKKASYDDADAFVLGAGDVLEPRRFGDSLVIVADATVALLEAVTVAYVGPGEITRMASDYCARIGAPPSSRMALRRDALAALIP
jgi:hypothetical protein